MGSAFGAGRLQFRLIMTDTPNICCDKSSPYRARTLLGRRSTTDVMLSLLKQRYLSLLQDILPLQPIIEKIALSNLSGYIISKKQNGLE
jgi:hypothetical protein